MDRAEDKARAHGKGTMSLGVIGENAGATCTIGFKTTRVWRANGWNWNPVQGSGVWETPDWIAASLTANAIRESPLRQAVREEQSPPLRSVADCEGQPSCASNGLTF